MRAKWVKDIPTDEGWYWIKYSGKLGTTKCPCRVMHIGQATVVHTAKNDAFYAGPNHGNCGLTCNGKPEKTIRFGPRIEEPEG